MTKINRWFSASLSRQLIVYTFAITYLLLIGFWTLLYLTLKHDLQGEDEGLIRDRIQTIANLLREESGASQLLTQRIEKEWFERNSERILVRVLDSRRDVLAETPHLSSEHAAVLSRLDERALKSPGLSTVTRLESGANIYETAIAGEAVGGTPYLIEIALV